MEPGNEWFATGSSDRTIKVHNYDRGIIAFKFTLFGFVSGSEIHVYSGT